MSTCQDKSIPPAGSDILTVVPLRETVRGCFGLLSELRRIVRSVAPHWSELLEAGYGAHDLRYRLFSARIARAPMAASERVVGSGIAALLNPTSANPVSAVSPQLLLIVNWKNRVETGAKLKISGPAGAVVT